MATTATAFVPAMTQFPYIGVGVAASQYITAIPSAEVTFLVSAGVVTVAAAGEDQRVLITCNLPRTFCYVLAESSLLLRSVDADNWDNSARCTFRDSSVTPEITIPVSYPADGLGHNTATEFSRTYVVKDTPNKLLVPISTDDAVFQIQLSNVTIDGAAGVLNFYARFFRYDRNQSQFWPVNTPQLVR